jgi:Flp pilus assembly protein TadG
MMGRKTCKTSSSGQALVETALVMPVIIFVILNAINFGYCYMVALDLAAAPRSGVLYSITGFQTPGTLSLPSAGPPGTNTTVSNLTYQDMTGALWNPAAATVQICSTKIGVTAAGQPSCVTCTCSGGGCGSGSCSSGGSVASTPTSAFTDPEPNNFYLDRVDVQYSFPPLIPGSPFGLLLGPLCSGTPVNCTFYRHTSMREMN